MASKKRETDPPLRLARLALLAPTLLIPRLAGLALALALTLTAAAALRTKLHTGASSSAAQWVTNGNTSFRTGTVHPHPKYPLYTQATGACESTKRQVLRVGFENSGHRLQLLMSTT